MAMNSRSGGYDLAQEKEQKRNNEEKKRALSNRTQNENSTSIGAQAIARGESDLEAPTSIGQLMSPSVGRGLPPDDPEFERQVQKNESFLSSPETRGALLQFGVALMATAGGGDIGSNIGQALGLAAGYGGRARDAQRKLDKEAREADLDERRIRIAETKLGFEARELGQEQDQKKQRKALFGALKNATDEQLMELASEMAANGDEEGARIALQMRRSSTGSGEATALQKNYAAAVAQGFKGTIMDYDESSKRITTLEAIRAKIAQGLPLSPGEQQVYDDAINVNPVVRILQQGTATTPPVNGAEAPLGATPSVGSGVVNGVDWSFSEEQ